MNLANKITIVRLCLIPLIVIFATPVPGFLDRILHIHVLQPFGIYAVTGIFALASATDKENLDLNVVVPFKAVETYDAPGHDANAMNLFSLLEMKMNGIIVAEGIER